MPTNLSTAMVIAVLPASKLIIEPFTSTLRQFSNQLLDVLESDPMASNVQNQ